MSLLKDRTIRKRVMAVIEGRIQQAQTSFDDGCVQLEERFESDVRDAEETRDKGKTDLAETLVQEIIGKIL